MSTISLEVFDKELVLRLLEFAKEAGENDSIATLEELLNKRESDSSKLVSVVRNLSPIIEAQFREVTDASGEIDYELDEPWQSREDDLSKFGSSL